MKVKINDKVIELKHSLRSIIIFESISNKPFGITTMTDISLYFYCSIMASESDLDLTFEEFLTWLDEPENEGLFQEFFDFNQKKDKIDNSLSPVSKQSKKKKVSKEKK